MGDAMIVRRDGGGMELSAVGKMVRSYIAAAGENISAGSFVYHVRKMFQELGTETVLDSTPTQGYNNQQPDICAIELCSNKVFLCFKSGTILKGVVVDIRGNTMTIGTAVTISNNCQIASAARMSDVKVLQVWGSNVKSVSAAVLTIPYSETTITVGPATIISPTTTTSQNRLVFTEAKPLSSLSFGTFTSAMIFALAHASSDAFAIKVSVSGATISIDFEAKIGSQDTYNRPQIATYLDKIVQAGNWSNKSNFLVYELSDTSLQSCYGPSASQYKGDICGIARSPDSASIFLMTKELDVTNNGSQTYNKQIQAELYQLLPWGWDLLDSLILDQVITDGGNGSSTPYHGTPGIADIGGRRHRIWAQQPSGNDDVTFMILCAVQSTPPTGTAAASYDSIRGYAVRINPVGKLVLEGKSTLLTDSLVSGATYMDGYARSFDFVGTVVERSTVLGSITNYGGLVAYSRAYNASQFTRRVRMMDFRKLATSARNYKQNFLGVAQSDGIGGSTIRVAGTQYP